VQRYYFDHNATTPVSPEVLEAMLPLLSEVYGNASSVHHFGQMARQKLDQARVSVARFLGALPEEIVFTSGGTEADNLAVLGAGRGGHAIVSAIEHPAVLAAAEQLAAGNQLSAVTQVPVDSNCVVDPQAVRRALRPDTKIISVMHANNETGAIQPVEEIARIGAEAGIPVHVDGVQAAGRIPVDVKKLGIAMYTISGHKLYAPKGVGALYVLKGTTLRPILHGGKHERSRRGGTENVAGAVALGRAAEWIMEHGAHEAARVAELRDRLEHQVLERIPDTHVNSAGATRVANTTNLRFDGIDSDALLIALDLKGFAVSSGAACSSGAPEPSHVLLAMGLTREQARSSIRCSLGRSNTADQVDALTAALVDCVAHLRKLSPVYV
jgi:cysteine desulfurase